MRKIYLFLVIFLIIVCPFFSKSFPSVAKQTVKAGVEESQKKQKETANGEKVKELKAVAGEDQIVEKGEKIIFNGLGSTNPLNTKMTYRWDFGDGEQVEGEEVMHFYKNPGEYKVTLTVDNGQEQDTDEVTVFVYEDLIVLVADKTVKGEKISSLKKYASNQGVLLVIIQDKSKEADYIIEESLVNTLLEERESLKKADIFITWTSGNLGLNVLSKLSQTMENIEDLNIKQKGVVVITDQSLSVVARIAQSTFDVLAPEYILLANDSVLQLLIDARSSDKVLEQVNTSGIDYRLIGIYSERAVKELGLTNFMSYMVNYLINKGVAINNIVLMLMLPLIAFLIAFLRQFLGIKTLGIYTPTIITLSFVAMGLKYGLTIFLVILLVATCTRLLLRRFRILYLPRMAIVLSIVALTILVMFVIGAYTGKSGIIRLSILPILVLIILIEKFINVQIEKGASLAIKLSLATILVSVACYYIVNWDFLKTLILSYPELVLLVLVIDIVIGKWRGLRLSEYFRFREIKKFVKEVKE